MLVENRQQSFEQLIASLDMRIQLTESLIESLGMERGVTRTNPFEHRRAARFRCNGECITRISEQSFHMPGQEAESRAIVRDLSRKGVGIIAHQQWYPEQTVVVQMPKATVTARVARVRKLGPNCFEIGLIVVGHELSE